MILTGGKKKNKKKREKVIFENKTILVLDFLRTEELNTTCSIFAKCYHFSEDFHAHTFINFNLSLTFYFPPKKGTGQAEL